MLASNEVLDVVGKCPVDITDLAVFATAPRSTHDESASRLLHFVARAFFNSKRAFA